MFYSNHPRFFICGIFLLLIFVARSLVFAETYSESVTNAQNNIDVNTNYIPNYPTTGNKEIITIQGTPAGEDPDFGLTYINYSGTNYLITRTFTKSRNFFNTRTQTLTGVGNYTTYGSASTDASWVTTGNDATKFLDGQSATAATVIDLLERGLGMNNDASHNMIVELAVLPNNDNMMRPTREPDIKSYSTTSSDYAFSNPFNPVQPADMDDTVYDNLTTYLDTWQKDALGTNGWHGLIPVHAGSSFPWTELGYTYFWNSGGTDLAHIQGMTEFIVLGGTAVKILGIYSPQSYVYTKNKGGIFSSASDAQYGNGFASFNVTGSCDTIWAGNAFQKNASSDSVSPNEIIVTSNGSVSGGQGILVWSPNYTITNSGTISGSTINKLYYNSGSTGLTNTANIGILFKGDTTYGSIAGGKNIVANSGTIQSPGVAIEAEKGVTEITNDVGGLISGDSYAILTSTLASSDDTVTLKGGSVTGSVDLGDGTDLLNLTGTNGNVTLNFYLDRNTSTSAQVYNIETVTIADNKATLGVTLLPGTQNIRDNESFLIVNATTLNADASKIAVQENTPLPMVSFTPQKTGNNLYLVSSRNNSYYAQNSGNSSLGNTLDSLANTASSDMATIIGALDTSGSASDATQLTPGVNNAINEAGYATQGQFINTIINRIGDFLTSLSGKGATGISSGDEPKQPQGVWAQAFDTYLHQGARGTSNGYNANVWGTSLGYDRAVLDSFIIGLNTGYAQDRIRSKDNSTRTDVDSYQVGMYGNYAKGPFYLDGIFSFAYNQYDSSRRIMFNSIDRTPKSDYGGQQYSTYLEGGYTFKKNDFEITPLTSLQYMHLRTNSYTEKDAGDANLDVDAQDYNLLQSGLGAKVSYLFAASEYTFIPEFHAKWLYEFLGEAQQTTSTFTGGGASFVTAGFSPAQSSYNLGLKLTLLTKQNISLSFGYDFEGKSDFYSHSGIINARYDF